jgi:hypothetical protein
MTIHVEAPTIDPDQAVKYAKILVRMASQTNDIDVVRKLLGEMKRTVDKATPKRPRGS